MFVNMPPRSNYDKFPVVQVSDNPGDCLRGWPAITERLRTTIHPGRFVICVECYPGCFQQEIERELASALSPKTVIRAENACKSSSEIKALVARDLTDDP